MSEPVLVTRLSAIGDIIIAGRTARKLWERGYNPIFLTQKSFLDVLLCMPWIDYVACPNKLNEIEIYKKDGGEFKLLQAEDHPLSQVNHVFDLQRTSRSRKALRSFKNKWTQPMRPWLVEKKTFFRFFLIFLSFFTFFQRRRSQAWNKENVTHIEETQWKLLEKFLNHQNSLNVVRTSKPFKVPGESYNKDKFENYVTIFPGASYFLKEWPKSKFRELITRILAETNLKVVICGSQGEAFLGHYLQYLSQDRIVNLVGVTSLRDTLSIIEHSEYVVSNDSFAGHAAEDFGKPASVIFGATSPFFGFAPKSEKIFVHYSNLNCSPCTRHGGRGCRFKNIQCLTSISSEDIFDKIKAQSSHIS